MPVDKIVTMDTDFLSSFLKIGRLNSVKDFFKKVSEEDYNMLMSEELEHLGWGEKECIAFCRQHQNSILLINDTKARKVARNNGIAVLNISAFLLACKRSMVLDEKEIALIMNDLKQKDYYEFSEHEKKILLNT